MPRARASADAIRVEGLDEFRKELRKLDDAALIEELKDANSEVADVIVRGAQSRASTRMERRAADTLKARRNQRQAEVSLGNSKVPFALGAEFGSKHNELRTVEARDIITRNFRSEIVGTKVVLDKNGKSKNRAVRKRVRLDDTVRSTRQRKIRGWNQFKLWRGAGENAGYFLFPTIREEGDQMVEVYGNAIDRLMSKAFPN